MKKKHTAQSAFLTLCILLGVLAFFAGILVALFAAAFLGERPAGRQWIGIALVAAGVFTLGWRR